MSAPLTAEPAGALTPSHAAHAAQRILLGRTLAFGCLEGLWPLEAFDPGPLTPPGRINLARAWIATHRDEWDRAVKHALSREASTDDKPLTVSELIAAATNALR
jgi:hypothetical protein